MRWVLATLSKEHYYRIVKNFLSYLEKFGVLSLNDLSVDTFITFLTRCPNTLLYAKPTLLQRQAALDLFFAWAVEACHVRPDLNPILYYKKWKIQPRRLRRPEKVSARKGDKMTVLTEKAQATLLALDHGTPFKTARNRAVITLLLSTALSLADLIALKKEDIAARKSQLT